MLPKLELHRGSSMEISSEEELGEGLEEEVERETGEEREHSSNQTQVRMHG